MTFTLTNAGNNTMIAPTLDQIRPYVAQGLIREQRRGNLSIFNYSEKCTYDRLWDDVTSACRGLILNRETGEVVALPWPKFFNHDQPEGMIPEGPPDDVTLKADGSLGVLYRDQGRTWWSTRGSFESPQAHAANQMWTPMQQYPTPDSWTVLSEIIHPSSRVVVRYGWTGFIILGARDRFTGAEVARDEVESWANEASWATGFDLPMVEAMPYSLADCCKLAQSLDHQTEGWVLRWGSHRLKVKTSAYRRIHRLVQGLTPRRIGDMWYSQDLATVELLDEPHLSELKGALNDLDEEMRAAVDTIGKAEAALGRTVDPGDRKSYAIQARESFPTVFSALMQRYSGKEADLRLMIYKRRFKGNPRLADQS